MANYGLALMLAIMISINVGLGLYDAGIQSYNPAFNSTIDYSGTPTSKLVYGGDLNGTSQLDSSLAIPESSDSVDPDTGNIFTDTFKSVSNWVQKINSKLGILFSVLNQPMGFLKDIGVPLIFANSFGILWYIILLLLIVQFIKGGGVD